MGTQKDQYIKDLKSILDEKIASLERHNSVDFDPEYYANNNPDVVQAFGKNADSLRKHFDEYGKKEGRNPNKHFNTQKYLEQNPDVRKAVNQGRLTAFEHWIHYGKIEGRALPL